jgi:hypothetical protein
MEKTKPYNLSRFPLACRMGKTVKALVLAYAGAWGLHQVMEWMYNLPLFG